MKYAESIGDIGNAFEPRPLAIDELDRFFCGDTMENRTGNKYNSPILDILEACKVPSNSNSFLLLGHRGCGKSTELNRMSNELMQDGYHVVTLHCARDLDMMNPVYSDLLILMGEALLEIAEKTDTLIDLAMQERFVSFWSMEEEETGYVNKTSDLVTEAKAKVGTPSFLSGILDVFASVRTDLRYSTETRTKYRKKVTHRTGEWLFMLNKIADTIAHQLEDKQPILIFEDLDKINPEDAWNIFSSYAATLTGVSFPVVYTFPIALAYDPRFTSLKSYYEPKILPMIKLERMDGSTYQDGIDAITNIIRKRADLTIFDERVIETLIKKTGGSLRDLFSCIIAAAVMALRRKSTTISMEDISVALTGLKSSLTRLIERKHYDFLADIGNGNRDSIEDKPMLLEMLQANAVLEYNTDRWHQVHPLVADFLRDKGLMER